MHDAEYFSLYDCLRFNQGCLVSQHSLKIRRSNLWRVLMQVSLCFSKIYVLRCCYDADSDVTTASIKQKGIKEFVIMHKEVQVQPERVGQDYLCEFGDAVVCPRSHNCATRLFDYDVACYKSSQKLEIILMSAFPALLFEGKFLLKHQTHQLVLPVTDDNHVYLLSYNLILHYNYEQALIHTYSLIFSHLSAKKCQNYFKIMKLIAFGVRIQQKFKVIIFHSFILLSYYFKNLQYLMEKSNSKDEERFNKAVEIYLKRYPLNIYSLIKFIEDKIAVTPEVKNIIVAQILSTKSRQESITKDELKMYLHMVAAAQSKVDIRGKRLESFYQFFRLAFKETKPKEQRNVGSDAKTDKKEERIQTKKGMDRQQIESKPEKQTLDKASEVKTTTISQSIQHSQEPSKDIPHKNRSSKDGISPRKQLEIIVQNVIDENRASNVVYRADTTQQLLLKMPQARMMNIKSSEKSVQITGYDKFGQNYLNPIIKFHIVYGEHSVYRRYSEFQKLMNDLSRRYEGFILPELPPKEGIKSNLSYFLGVDEAFLNDRQLKLQEMLNSLLASKFINKDEILQKFLKDQDFQIESSNEGGLISYLKPITSISLNTKQLKNYAVAYCNYLQQFNKAEINTIVTARYKQVQPLLNFCLAIDNYRNTINSNFEKRRDIFKELGMDKDDRNLTITKFDKLSSSSANEIKNLSKQINKYLELKSQESWLMFLIREKQTEAESDMEQLKKSKEEVTSRINAMEANLITSIDELKKEKKEYLQTVGDKMMEWRRAIHP